MKLESIKNFIKKNGIQKKYNRSLNYHRINSPKNTFYSTSIISEFAKKGDLSYLDYYKYLTEKISNGQPFVEYLRRKAKEWIKKDNQIKEKEAITYLLNSFFIIINFYNFMFCIPRYTTINTAVSYF